jgi:hypothetical protein
MGQRSLSSNTSGNSNIAVGPHAGDKLTTGSNNKDIGNRGVAGEADTIRIGDQQTQTTIFVAGISGVPVRGDVVVVNGNGKLGVVPSSQRFKDAIKPMDKTSEAILALKPVTFRYKKEIDPDRTPQFGLVAEQVEKINPNLVVRDKEGKPYTVRYDQVNAMLLNEFLKEHRTVEEQSHKIQEQEATMTQLKTNVAEQQATTSQLKKGIEAVTAQLKKQDSKIQKVSDQIQLRKPAPQLAHNGQ